MYIIDLWKAATVLPLRIRRSGVLLQGKCTALPAFSQSAHKCNGGRIKLPAKRRVASINSSRISALADNWKHVISSTKWLDLNTGTLSGWNVLLLASVVRSWFEWSNEAWGENCKAGTGVVTSVLCPEKKQAALSYSKWNSKLPASITTGQHFKRFGLVILKLS